jgi:hypothetical protein
MNAAPCGRAAFELLCATQASASPGDRDRRPAALTQLGTPAVSGPLREPAHSALSALTDCCKTGARRGVACLAQRGADGEPCQLTARRARTPQAGRHIADDAKSQSRKLPWPAGELRPSGSPSSHAESRYAAARPRQLSSARSFAPPPAPRRRRSRSHRSARATSAQSCSGSVPSSASRTEWPSGRTGR